VRRGPAVFFLTCLLVASAYGAQRVMREAAARVTGFSPAHLTAARPPSGPPPLVRRTVLILADGLRSDDALLLPTVDWLSQRGAQLRITVPQPGHRLPATASLLTGARPEVHGVLLGNGSLKADSLPSGAKRVGLKTGGAGGADVGKLLGIAMDTWVEVNAPGDLVEKSRSLLSASGPALVVLHSDYLAREMQRIHTASRDSADYRNALARFDYTLARLVEQVDLQTSAVVLAGTVPTGPAGTYLPDAPVPLLMAGAGVKPGYRGEASLLDVASTLSALSGAPVPLPNEGKPVLAALGVPAGRPTDLVFEQVLASRMAFTENALAALGSMAVAPDAPLTPAGADAYVAGLDRQIREARFAAWREWGLNLAPYAGGALVLVLLYLIVVWRQPFGATAFVGTLIYAAAFHVIFFLAGGRYSAAMNGLEDPQRTGMLLLAACSAGAMAVTVLATGFLLSRKGFKKRAYVAGAGLHTALTTSVLMALPVAVVLGRTGWDFPVSLPAVGLVVWFFVTCVHVMVIGYLSPLWGALTVTSAALSRQWWPLREIGDPERNADKVVRLKALRRKTK